MMQLTAASVNWCSVTSWTDLCNWMFVIWHVTVVMSFTTMFDSVWRFTKLSCCFFNKYNFSKAVTCFFFLIGRKGGSKYYLLIWKKSYLHLKESEFNLKRKNCNYTLLHLILTVDSMKVSKQCGLHDWIWCSIIWTVL